MKLKIQATNVLERSLKAEKDNKIICHEGGSRSSKTYSIFQQLFLKALSREAFDFTITRSKLTWLKSTLLKDFEAMTRQYGLPVSPEINPKRPEQIYKMYNSEFAFFGLDDKGKLHGRKQHVFWMNEVMEDTRDDFDQLEMRTSDLGILDYNPYDDQHWVFNLQLRPDVAVIHSTMLDNPFLPESIITKIRSYEPTEENVKNGTADAYMWDVYGQGKKARLEGAIFRNWTIEPVPETARLVGYGLDFGFTNDPTSLTAMYQGDGEVYFHEMLYETDLVNQDIAARMKDMGVDANALIYADSAEPKSIKEIQHQGFRNIRPVSKGRDSVIYGIDILKSVVFHITPQSINAENELRRYKWAQDSSGRSLNKPIDDFNHWIDAARYIASMTLGHKPQVKVLSREDIGI